MYEEHPVFNPPENENVKIWRYLDIPKFLWLLERKSLYFPRCDLLGDPFEGSLPSTSSQPIIKPLNDPKLPKMFSSLEDMWRKDCFICSFHMSDYESAALWSVYTKAKQGVAIQSTFKRLVDCFNNYHLSPVYIGMVNYIDYKSEIIDISNSFSPILHKRKSFEHERELRAVILYPYGSPTQPEGLNVKIKLDSLIESIYLAPTTKPWIIELLSSMMRKNRIKKPLEQSSLDAKPII